MDNECNEWFAYIAKPSFGIHTCKIRQKLLHQPGLAK